MDFKDITILIKSDKIDTNKIFAGKISKKKNQFCFWLNKKHLKGFLKRSTSDMNSYTNKLLKYFVF